MENAVDAIKIAFGIFVFVIALTLAVSVIGQARAASDVIFHFNDKTEFYEYVVAENGKEERIVGMETIIPTIHRYAKEQFAVTIFDEKGNPIVRYDLWTEGMMSDWNQILKKYQEEGSSESGIYQEVKNRFQLLQDSVNKTLDKPQDDFNMDTIEKLYKVINPYNDGVTVGAPWIGDNNQILERIRCDMIGGNYVSTKLSGSITGIRYKGKNLKQYNNSTFIEKFIEVTTSGETITEGEYSLETIKGNKKLEIIYILQK